ncbi:MAG TPA: hypothetical protein VHU82_06380 [Vicinamibacterales bacterium]|jgi:hypothetical protein|nr:hypothetical protein [Vicinamibacterales bacterium]
MKRTIDPGNVRRAAQCTVFALVFAATAIITAPVAASVNAPNPETQCASRAHSALPPPRLHVALQVEFPPSISAGITSDAIAEASSIWAHYGVDVFRGVSSPCAPPAGNVIALRVITSSQRANPYATPLGAIEFSPDGVPGNVITVFYDDIVQFSTKGFAFSPEPQLPLARRDQVTGRVLGRVLAHELGHFLLRSRAHASEGLMRSVQLVPDLTGGPINHFLLSASQAQQLDRLLASSEDTARPPLSDEARGASIRSGKTGVR